MTYTLSRSSRLATIGFLLLEPTGQTLLVVFCADLGVGALHNHALHLANVAALAGLSEGTDDVVGLTVTSAENRSVGMSVVVAWHRGIDRGGTQGGAGN